MKDFGSNGYFLWTDDTAVQFTNWNPGEPNHRMGDDQERFANHDLKAEEVYFQPGPFAFWPVDRPLSPVFPY